MKRCLVRPYEGADNYIFVSYCHQDKKDVYPIIERLARDGYRVWYDEGINPGADWPEVIADHLSRCALCIAFLSDNALNSHNCRREINFTLLKRKPLIAVAIENVSMSPGMQMQLSSAQSIPKVGMTDDEFFAMLYRSPLLASSQGEPDYSIRVSSAADYDDHDAAARGGMTGPSFSDMWFSEHENNAGYESQKVNVTYHPTYQPDPQTIRVMPAQKSEHTKVYSKEEFNKEASLKPVRMKSGVKRIEEPQPSKQTYQPQQSQQPLQPLQSQQTKPNDSQRHLKWLIPLMIILMVLALILSIVAVVLSRSGIKTQLPKINEIVYQGDTVTEQDEQALTELNNVKISPEGYRCDKTDYFFKGVVFHGDYTTSEDVSDDFFTQELSCRINLYDEMIDQFTIGDKNDVDSYNPFFGNNECIISLNRSTDDLETGDYTVEVGTADADTFSVLFSISFEVEPETVNEYHTSFTLNDVGNEIEIKDYPNHYVKFYNGYLTTKDNGYQMTVKEGKVDASYRVVADDKSSPDEKENLDQRVDHYFSGIACICGEKDPYLQIVKFNTDPRLYMPNLVDWDADQAIKLLEDSGIKSEIAYEECQDASLGNKVRDQSVKRGSMMNKNANIGLTVYQNIEKVNPTPPKSSQKTDTSYQQKLIVTKIGDGPEAEAELMEYSDGEWKSVATYAATVGKNGIGTAQEGAGITPKGTFDLGKVIVKGDQSTDMPTYDATENTGFVSNVESEYYNQLMEKEDYPDGTNFDLVYDEFANAMIIIEFNGDGFSSDGVIAGGGSAIGLRGKSGELGATYGDVDISEDDMNDLLSRLDPAKNPVIVIGD